MAEQIILVRASFCVKIVSTLHRKFVLVKLTMLSYHKTKSLMDYQEDYKFVISIIVYRRSSESTKEMFQKVFTKESVYW